MLAMKPNSKWRFCVGCRNLDWLTSATVGHFRVLMNYYRKVYSVQSPCTYTCKTESEFIARLIEVLKRCKSIGLILNPKKCKFGMPEIQVLEHTLNRDGTH
jgi:hypothetical protein